MPFTRHIKQGKNTHMNINFVDLFVKCNYAAY